MSLMTERVDGLKRAPAFASLSRSLAVYYGDAPREAAMDALYARFVRPGDLAFDIGSHVGDRIGAFRRIGARVVALEPQPLCAEVIRTIYGATRRVAGRGRMRADSGPPEAAHQLRQPDGHDGVAAISSRRRTAPVAGKGRYGIARSRCR